MASRKQIAIRNMKLIAPNWLDVLVKWEKQCPKFSRFQLWPSSKSKIMCPEDPQEICFSITNTHTCVVGEGFYSHGSTTIKQQYGGCKKCADVSFDKIFQSDSWSELWIVLYDWTEHFLKKHSNRLVRVEA